MPAAKFLSDLTLDIKGKTQYHIVRSLTNKRGENVSKDDCGMWVNVLSHKLKKRMNATLSEFGITGVQAHVLRFIIENGKSGPVYQRDVEKAFEMSRSTTTGILQLLEKSDVIARESVPEDARLKRLVPTVRAREINTRVQERIRDNEVQMTRGLSPGQVQLFLETARQMSSNLDRAP